MISICHTAVSGHSYILTHDQTLDFLLDNAFTQMVSIPGPYIRGTNILEQNRPSLAGMVESCNCDTVDGIGDHDHEACSFC